MKRILRVMYIICIGLIFIPTLSSCSTHSKGFNYSAHAKKNKNLKSSYRGNLTQFKCNKR